MDLADDLAIQCSDVRKSYGSRCVLDGVNLQVRYGSILALLGRNGAGKSTLISMLCGLLKSDSGSMRVAGFALNGGSPNALGSAIGLAPQDLGLYPQLTVMQNLTSMAMVQGLPPRNAQERAEGLIDMFGLGGQPGQRAESLSGGQKRRLHTAMALVHSPRVLFLDEPTVGADVEARSSILQVVRGIADSGTAVLYTTHYMEEVEQLGADVAFLDRDSIVDQGSIHDIVKRHAAPSIRVSFAGGLQPEVNGWTRAGGGIEPDCPIDDPGRALAALLSDPHCRDVQLKDVQVIHANLETAYRNIVGSGGGGGVASGNPEYPERPEQSQALGGISGKENR
ncbi:MAG: ABC transporter ATP-binding protein [Bifidobacterium tibiigranuli]|jgi:ABC-2 type transport system ATP-binding protein|uniref:ABC transporter ATP-binding protein n=1 Tax=Bifidobacterium tibiigranuli TaxID=2172043 RepID=UPI0026EBBABE|nr:ABC transporter ATP-binding protein [Bifidobacterium tibiigranuli]MCI1673671.1 ABC transporter ATP-binding protein [Bifidobacterium tibiigranuli]MCI1712927.1 ABC transporter ATP-binding protein [Bifidobacterium tibiigranuli]MCI1833566.1 ABC transporter ATP-binding protein [Bifidobacterium tibiigranuli]